MPASPNARTVGWPCGTYDTGVQDWPSLIVSVVAAYAIGVLPLGAFLLTWWHGRDVRRVNPHLIGVENAFRWWRPVALLVAFVIDVTKGFAVAWLFGGAPAAILAVLLGHAWPPQLGRQGWRVRGRGYAVMLGALLALPLLGMLPAGWMLIALVFALVIAIATRYVVLGVLAGLVLLTVASWPAPAALLGILGYAAVRLVPSLTQILDGTEPKIGDPPGVPVGHADTVRVAFMIHPMAWEDVAQVKSLAWLVRLAPEGSRLQRWVVRVLPHMPPQVHDVLKGIRLNDGRDVEVVLLGGAMMPHQIRSDEVNAMRTVRRAARLARSLGASGMGLGALWSTVADKGVTVQREFPDVPLTDGGTFTAASSEAVVPALIERFERRGATLKSTTAAVIGATGMVGFGMARKVAPHVGTLLLIGKDERRLKRSAHTLAKRFKDTTVNVATHYEDLPCADLVFTATSDPNPVVQAAMVRPGAWIYDMGRPTDVADGVYEVPGVEVVPGGVVEVPGRLEGRIDLHFGQNAIPACLAETILLAADGAWDRVRLGQPASADGMAWLQERAAHHGFHVVVERAAAVPLHEAASA